MNEATRGASITLIVKGDPLTPVTDHVGLLIESAPDAALPFDPAQQASMAELLGSYDEAKRRAWELTQSLLADEEPIDGVRQLRVSEELIIRELESIFLAIHLHRWLCDHGFEVCRFRAASPWIERLRQIQHATSSTYRIEAPPQTTVGRAEKIRTLLRLNGVQGLSQAVVLAARQLFPTVARYVPSLVRRKGTRPRGGWWFYSTAYTYTNIGLDYERYCPNPLNYLCEDANTSGLPLRERRREYSELYAFSSWKDIPRAGQLARARRNYASHLSCAEVSAEQSIARDVLLASNELNSLFGRILPLTLFHSRIFRRWMSETQPEAIVVGNAAYEGILLQLASQHGVPTLLLQHGVLGDYYQLMEHSVDALFVRGKFWRDFVSAAMRARTHIVNVPFEARTQRSDAQDLLFLSSVDSALANTHQSDFREIVTSLVRAAHQEKRRLIVRIHPRENPNACRTVVEQVCQQLRISPEVVFSSGAGLEDVLQSSAVAVTYCSTVFLDCLRLGIPVISFEWHNFSYKRLLKSHDVFSFAQNLEHLEQLVVQGLRGELPVPSTFDQFMAPTESATIARFLEGFPKLSDRIDQKRTSSIHAGE